MDDTDPRGYSRQQGHITGTSVQQQRGIFRQFPQVFINSKIRTDLHAILRQFLPDVRRDRFLRHIEACFVKADQRVGHGNRIEGDISAPDVKEPCDIIQTGDEHPVGPAVCHMSAQAIQLVLSGSAGIFLFQNPNGGSRKSRPVGPDPAHQILCFHKADILGIQRFMQGIRKSSLYGPSVIAQGLAGFQTGRDPFCKSGDAGLSHLLQKDARICQLVRSLQEISAVCPEGRFLHCHGQGSGRSGEAGHISPAFKIIPHIFRSVEIAAHDQIGVDPGLFHQAAQGFDSLSVPVRCHSYSLPCLHRGQVPAALIIITIRRFPVRPVPAAGGSCLLTCSMAPVAGGSCLLTCSIVPASGGSCLLTCSMAPAAGGFSVPGQLFQRHFHDIHGGTQVLHGSGIGDPDPVGAVKRRTGHQGHAGFF